MAAATISSSSSTRSPHELAPRLRKTHSAGSAAGLKPRESGVDETLAEHALITELSKLPAGTLGRPTALGTNAFELDVKNDEQLVYLYDVRVVQIVPGRTVALGNRETDLTGKTGGKDANYVRCRELCYHVWYTMLVKFAQEFGHPAYFMYDRARNMYSCSNLENFVPKAGRTFTVKAADVCEVCDVSMKEMAERFLVTKTTASFQLTLQPADQCRDTFTVFGTGAIFERKGAVDLGSGMQMRKGFKKSVGVTEGRNDQPTLRFFLDVKGGAFFKPGPLDSALKEMLGANTRVTLAQLNDANRRRLSALVRGIIVTAKPTGCQVIVHALSDKSAAKQTFFWADENRTVTVQEYFESHHDLRLGAAADLPCVVQKRTMRDSGTASYSYYPMTLCHVAPNQRVPNSKFVPIPFELQSRQPLEVTQQLIRQSAQPPSTRLMSIDGALGDTNIPDSVVLQALGLELSKQRVQISGRQMPLPSAIYKTRGGAAKQQITPIGDMATWRTGQAFLRPASVDKWAFVVGVVGNHPAMNEAAFKKLGVRFMERARSLGMELPEPAVQFVPDVDGHAPLEQLFERALKEKVQFVMLLTGPNSDAHATLKRLEQRTGILTQHILSKSALRIVDRGDQTCLDNYLCKMNTKLGGLCYGIDTSALSIPKSEFTKSTRMFIGLDVNHAAPVPNHVRAQPDFVDREPSVVGFCVNVGKTCFDFAGDYHYQRPRVEVAEAMSCNIVTEMLTHFLGKFKDQRGVYPEEILLWRDGVSEGMYERVIRSELRQMRKATRALGCSPKICIVLVQKRHNVRLFLPDKMVDKSRKAPEQNVRPGTVVDTDLVHYSFPEFFLHSHKTIQGTGRTPRYTVLLNEPNYSMDELQATSMAMCYGHGIVPMAVSVPAPLYAAHELAKRGKCVLKAHLQKLGIDIFSSSSNGGRSPDNMPSLQELNASLTYGQLGIGDQKFWG